MSDRAKFLLQESKRRAVMEYGINTGADIGFGFSPESNTALNKELPGSQFINSREYICECGFKCSHPQEIFEHIAQSHNNPPRCECGHLESSHILGICRVRAAGERFDCGCEKISK